MKEIIKWHKYPDEKPKESYLECLVTYEFEEELYTCQAVYRNTAWYLDAERISMPVIAWAEMPKGYDDDGGMR